MPGFADPRAQHVRFVRWFGGGDRVAESGCEQGRHSAVSAVNPAAGTSYRIEAPAWRRHTAERQDAGMARARLAKLGEHDVGLTKIPADRRSDSTLHTHPSLSKNTHEAAPAADGRTLNFHGQAGSRQSRSQDRGCRRSISPWPCSGVAGDVYDRDYL